MNNEFLIAAVFIFFIAILGYSGWKATHISDSRK